MREAVELEKNFIKSELIKVTKMIHTGLIVSQCLKIKTTECVCVFTAR